MPVGEALPPELRALIPWLVLAHALFGTALLLLMMRQGWLGWCIARHGQNSASAARTHLQSGRWLPHLLEIQLLFGLLLVGVDKGELMRFAPHLLLGCLLLALTYANARFGMQLKGPDDPKRRLHKKIGMAMLSAMLLQLLLGLGIML